MSTQEADIAVRISNRVEAELPLLTEHLRRWVEAHRTQPREITASSDPEITQSVHVSLVTDHIGEEDANSRVVYDPARDEFGLMMELENGVLWYMGPYGSLVDTVESI
jgi:hypothetical protein